MRFLYCAALFSVTVGMTLAVDGIDPAKLVGKWEDKNPEKGESVTVEFGKDGNVKFVRNFKGKETTYEGNYKVEGDKLTMKVHPGNKLKKSVEKVITIDKLTDSEFVQTDDMKATKTYARTPVSTTTDAAKPETPKPEPSPNGTLPGQVTLSGHKAEILAVAYSRDGKYLASADTSGTIKVWNPAAAKELATLDANPEEPHASAASIDFSPDGKLIASACGDKSVKLWDTSTWKEAAALGDHMEGVMAVAFSPNGKLLVSGDSSGTIKIWDVASRKTTGNIAAGTGLACLAINLDNNTLATGDYAYAVTMYDLASKKKTATLSPLPQQVYSVAFSPNGKSLAAGCGDFTARIWDLSSKQLTATMRPNEGWVNSVAFSRDGKKLVSGDNKSVRLWDVDSEKAIAVYEGHSGRVMAVAFSPDGKTIASGSKDKTVKLWDTTGSSTPATPVPPKKKKITTKQSGRHRRNPSCVQRLILVINSFR